MKLIETPRATEADIALAIETRHMRVWHLRTSHPWDVVNRAEFFADVVHLFRRDDRIEIVCDTTKRSSAHGVIVVDDPPPEGGFGAHCLAIYREAA